MGSIGNSGTSHGKKPPNPKTYKFPGSNGTKPPPPPARTGRNMGKSSFASPGMVKVAWVLVLGPVLAVGSAVGYVVAGWGS